MKEEQRENGELLNITQWREQGMKPKNGEEPRETLSRYGGGIIKLFDASQVEPIRKRKPSVAAELPKNAENIARACWTVNRTAKRYRDAAQSHYQGKRHGFAKSSREKKEDLYRLKDIAIAYLAAQAHIKAERIHGSLCFWVGMGYSFHSTIAPKGMNVDTSKDERLKIEAKPKGVNEMRLIDAKHLLFGLEDFRDTFSRLEAPKHERTKRHEVVCYNCGEAGHIASECDDDEIYEEL